MRQDSNPNAERRGQAAAFAKASASQGNACPTPAGGVDLRARPVKLHENAGRTLSCGDRRHALPHRGAAGRWRDGRRLQGGRHQAAPASGAEISSGRRGAHAAIARAIRAGSAGGFGAQSSEYLHDLRHRHAKRPPVHRHGTVARRDAEACDRGRAGAVRDFTASQHADRGCARRRTPAGHHSSRHQTREHFRHGARPGQAAGFWSGESAATGDGAVHRCRRFDHARGHEFNQPRRGPGDRGVYVSGANARQRAGRAHGSFFVRRGAVRNVHGAAGVFRQHFGGNLRFDPASGAGGSGAIESQNSGGTGAGD